jgi:outer membrane protein assembly factor BamB
LVQQRGKPAWRLWRFDAQKGTPSDSADVPDLNGIAWPPVPVLIGGQLRLAVLAVPVYAPACHIFSSDEPLQLVGRRGVPAWSPEDAQRFAIVGSDLYLSEFPDTRIEGGPSLFRISLDPENRVVWRVPNISIPDRVLADANGVYIGVYIPLGDQVVCLEPADGALRWKVSGHLLAISESVVLAAANPAPKATTTDILALDPKTGKILWRARPSAGIPAQVVTDSKWIVCVSQDEPRRRAVFDVFAMPK